MLLLKERIVERLDLCFWKGMKSEMGFLDALSKVLGLDTENETSQIEQKNYTKKALALNEYRGLQKNRDFAEAFCIVDVPVFKKMCDECI